MTQTTGSLIEALTVGEVIDKIREAGHELISHGNDALNDNLITAGNVAISAANALAAAYNDQLEKTFAEIESTNDQLSDELRRLIKAIEQPLDQAHGIVNSSGAVISKLPLADALPVITLTKAPLVDLKNGNFELELHGFNLEHGELEVISNLKNVKVSKRISTKVFLSGKLGNVEIPNDQFYVRIPLQLIFRQEKGWFRSDDEMTFTASITAVSWSDVQARVTYNDKITERIYNSYQQISGSHGRVARRHSYRADFTPESPAKIDPESFKVTKWREHTECAYRETYYDVEEVSQQRIRIQVRGKEEGGLWKECGTRLRYKFRTFVEETRFVSITSDWQDYDMFFSLTYPDGSDFVSLELKLGDGSILTFSEDVSPVGFMELVDSEEIRRVALRKK